MTIRAVTFDCWGTLITDHDFATATDVRVRAITEAAGGRLDEASARDLLDRAWREHHRRWLEGRQHGSPGIARYCTTELGLDDERVCALLQEAFEEAGRHGKVEALPGAADTLKTLRVAGVRTALVCDAGFTPGRIVRHFLDDWGLLEHLEYCAFSNEIGEPKPSAKIFLDALGAIHTSPDQSVHVGDLLRTDIFGARALGMRTVRINAVNDDAANGFSWIADPTFDADEIPLETTPPFEDADAVVSSHAELLDVLERMGAPLVRSG